MRHVLVSAGFALAVVGALGCSAEQPRAASPPVSLAPIRHAPPVRRQARDLILAADLEMDDLNDMQYHARNDAYRDAVARQIAGIAAWRERVAADVAPAGSWGADDARLRVDMSNLERAMRAGATTRPQSRPTDSGRTFGDYDRESLPPNR
jgi:hypothetical protein